MIDTANQVVFIHDYTPHYELLTHTIKYQIWFQQINPSMYQTTTTDNVNNIWEIKCFTSHWQAVPDWNISPDWLTPKYTKV